jgi:hypothetical protein
MEAKQRFWMVYGLGLREPTHRHETYESAMTEARRLARGDLDQTFVVLEAIAAVRKSEFTTTILREPNAPAIDEDGIPF